MTEFKDRNLSPDSRPLGKTLRTPQPGRKGPTRGPSGTWTRAPVSDTGLHRRQRSRTFRGRDAADREGGQLSRTVARPARSQTEAGRAQRDCYPHYPPCGFPAETVSPQPPPVRHEQRNSGTCCLSHLLDNDTRIIVTITKSMACQPHVGLLLLSA